MRAVEHNGRTFEVLPVPERRDRDLHPLPAAPYEDAAAARTMFNLDLSADLRTIDAMGYAIHISRASDWTRSEETPISLEEWRAATAADPTLDSDDDDPNACDWTGHPRKYDLPTFHWANGQIEVEHPDDHTVGKALSIARQLQAYVVGDDGEVHDEPLPSLGRDEGTQLTEREKLVRHALNRGCFQGGWVRRGIVPRAVRLTVHTADGHNYFLIIVHHGGPPQSVDDRTSIDVVALSSDLKIEPHKFLGRTVGFRVQTNAQQIAVRVKEPEHWIRLLRHPDQPTELKTR